MAIEETLSHTFSSFFAEAEPKLRHALVAALGVDSGVEAAAEALTYGWEHWERIGAMENPAGYLYRVGLSRGRRMARRPSALPPVRNDSLPWVEAKLPDALETLSQRQRVAVVLVHSLDWSQTEVADLLGITQGAVRTHLQRGLARLRSKLGVEDV